MRAARWLELGDELIFDGDDYGVTRVFIVRADRLSFQVLDIYPTLGGEAQRLLQVQPYHGDPSGALALRVEGKPSAGKATGTFTVELVEPGELQGEEATIADRTLRLRWEAVVRTEQADRDGEHRFGLARCAYYEGDDGCVAVRVEEGDEGYAVLGTPLDPSRLDLRFT